MTCHADPPIRLATDRVVSPEGAWFGLEELDRQLFTQLAEVTSTFKSGAAKIWGFGFRPELRPTLLVRQGHESYGYALNIDNAAALGDAALGGTVELVPLPENLGLSPVYRFGADLVNDIGLTEEEPVQFAVDIAGQECLALSYDTVEAHASSWEFARFFVHEAFHQYQMFEMAWRVPTGYDPSLPWVNDSTDVEMATREMWFLEAAAVQNTSPTQAGGAAELVTSFLGLRAERHARRPDLIALEHGHEQIEGSARFVENNYASMNGRQLRLPIPTGIDLDPDEFARIGRHYRTGARVMELLDRTQIPWRHRLAEGQDPVSILIEVLEGQSMSAVPRLPVRVTIDLANINLTEFIDIRDSDVSARPGRGTCSASNAAA